MTQPGVAALFDDGQRWFWTPQWQAGEREADAAIAAGETQFFASSEEFLAWLDEQQGERGDQS